MVAAPMTLLMPGAGPPAQRMASLFRWDIGSGLCHARPTPGGQNVTQGRVDAPASGGRRGREGDGASEVASRRVAGASGGDGERWREGRVAWAPLDRRARVRLLAAPTQRRMRWTCEGGARRGEGATTTSSRGGRGQSNVCADLEPVAADARSRPGRKRRRRRRRRALRRREARRRADRAPSRRARGWPRRAARRRGARRRARPPCPG